MNKHTIAIILIALFNIFFVVKITTNATDNGEAIRSVSRVVDKLETNIDKAVTSRDIKKSLADLHIQVKEMLVRREADARRAVVMLIKIEKLLERK